MITIKIPQSVAENQLSDLHSNNPILGEHFKGQPIRVEIEPNFIRSKVQLIRFLRDSYFTYELEVMGKESSTIQTPSLAWAKKYVEEYFGMLP